MPCGEVLQENGTIPEARPGKVVPGKKIVLVNEKMEKETPYDHVRRDRTRVLRVR